MAENSRELALRRASTLPKKIACGAGPPAALRGFGIYARNAQSLPDSCQKAWQTVGPEKGA